MYLDRIVTPRFRSSCLCALLVLTALLCLAPARARGGEGRRPAHTLTVVTWSDIHFGNVEYQPQAWREAYDEGRRLRPDVVVMCGDQIDSFQSTAPMFANRLERFLTDLRRRLDRLGAPVVLAYGNNDFAEDYQTDPALLAVTTSAYRRLLGPYAYLDDLGNGVYPRGVGGMTWISLNSVIFSPLNRYAGRQEQARRTFGWLERTLRGLAPGRPIVLVMHVSPTFDLYSGHLSWERAHVRRLSEILGRYRGPVVMLAGHYHRNEIHGFEVAGRGPVPVLVTGSVSFKFGNHPCWRTSTWTLGADGGVRRFDWRNRYPGHPAWTRAWSLDAPYAVSTYRALMRRLGDDVGFYLRYLEDLYAHNARWRTWADGAGQRRMVVDQLVPTPAEGAPPAPRQPAPASPAAKPGAASATPAGEGSMVPVP